MWFEWLFKYPRHAFAQGELAFAGDVGMVWWGVAAALLALSIVFGRRVARFSWPRRVAIHLLQAGAIAVVLALLAEPVLEVTRLAPGANTVAVLVDTSMSMDLPVDPDRETRLDLAKRLVAGPIQSASRDAKVALFGFDRDIERVEDIQLLAAQGDRSHMIESVGQLAAHYDQGALAAVVVLTDGADNGQGDLDELTATGVPVHTVGIGPAEIDGDVELAELILPPRAGPDTQVTARLVIRHSSGGEVRVRILDGESVLGTETVALDPANPTVTKDIAFASGATGLKEVTVELETAAADPLPGNNSRSRLLVVDREPHRVLYLEGEPRWEYKFIRRAVAEDDDIKLASWLRTTPRKTYRQGNASPDDLADGFPPTMESLFGYDMVILGSLPATALSDEQHDWLARFVAERGGGLLALAGRQALQNGGWDVKPLGAALPVVLERSTGPEARPSFVAGNYAAYPTDAGMRSVLTDIGGEADRERVWETLPMLADYHSLGPAKAGATVVLEVLGSVEQRGGDTVVRGGAGEPLLVTQVYGYGRTAVLATASTWRWRMRTPPDDARHSLFWRQLIRHFAAAALPRRHLALATEGDSLTVRVALKNQRFEPVTDTALEATVTAPDGESFAVPLAPIAGQMAFGQTIPAPETGIYRVEVAGVPGAPAQGAGIDDLRALARVGNPNIEQFDATLNDTLLRRLAEATGGRYWQGDELDGLGDALAFGSAGIQERQQLPLWNAPFLFLVLLLLKGIEWSLRRYWGGI